MIRRIWTLIKKIDEPDKFEITWKYFFSKIIFLILFFFFGYYLEYITEFMSAIFGDGNKYLPVNESRKEFRMIIVSVMCLIGAIPTLYVLYKLIFKKNGFKSEVQHGETHNRNAPH